MVFGLFWHVVSYKHNTFSCLRVFPCSLTHIWNTKLRVGLSCWFIFIFSYDDWGQLVLTTSTFVFLLEMKAEGMKENLDLIWSCFFLPWRSACILTTAQLESASCKELTAVVSWGWQLYRSRGKTLLNAPLCFTESEWTWVGGVVGGIFPLMLHKECGCCFVIMPSQHRVTVLKPNNKPTPSLYLYCSRSWVE